MVQTTEPCTCSSNCELAVFSLALLTRMGTMAVMGTLVVRTMAILTTVVATKVIKVMTRRLMLETRHERHHEHVISVCY